MLDAIAIRLAELPARAASALPAAAARIQAKLRVDATTRRGNVPGFGKMGGPITVEASDDGVAVDAPSWVLAKARALGQPKAWLDIVREEVRTAMGSR